MHLVDLYFKRNNRKVVGGGFFSANYYFSVAAKCTVPYNYVMPAKRASDRHKRKTVSFRLPEQLMDQLRALARKNRRTLSGEAQIAFEQHLTALGVGPVDGEKNGDR
jgi:hypothetical protein